MVHSGTPALEYRPGDYLQFDIPAFGEISLREIAVKGEAPAVDHDDAAGQLLHLVNHKPDATVLSRFDYSYDSRGRATSMTTSYGTWTYEYDDMGQLTHAVLASTDPSVPSQELTYVYDPLGNLARTRSRAFDPLGRLARMPARRPPACLSARAGGRTRSGETRVWRS